MDTVEKLQPATLLIAPKIKMRLIKLNIIICPATMLAKRRIIKAAGLINTAPANSTGINISFTAKGTPGGQKICPQKWPFVLAIITTNEIIPSTAVKAVLPVTLARPGTNPKILFMRMKKNTVNK